MRRHLWWVLAVVLIGCGAAVALAAQARPGDFGWFAYSPSSNDPGSSDGPWTVDRPWASMGDRSTVIVSRGQLAGGALVTLGLLVIAAGAGFRLGRRGVEPRDGEQRSGESEPR